MVIKIFFMIAYYIMIYNKIYCINLNRKKEKFNIIENRFKNLKIERHIATDGIYLEKIPDYINPILDRGYDKLLLNKSEWGTIDSHISIWKKVKENSLILEDDVIPLSDFKDLDQYLKHIPSDWDIIFIGGCYTRKYYLKNINKYVEKYIGEKKNDENPWLNCCHSYIININVIPKLLNLIEKNKIEGPIDVWLGLIGKNFNFYRLKNELVIQDNSKSNIFHCCKNNKIQEDYEKQNILCIGSNRIRPVYNKLSLYHNCDIYHDIYKTIDILNLLQNINIDKYQCVIMEIIEINNNEDIKNIQKLINGNIIIIGPNISLNKSKNIITNKLIRTYKFNKTIFVDPTIYTNKFKIESTIHKNGYYKDKFIDSLGRDLYYFLPK